MSYTCTVPDYIILPYMFTNSCTTEILLYHRFPIISPISHFTVYVFTVYVYSICLTVYVFTVYVFTVYVFTVYVFTVYVYSICLTVYVYSICLNRICVQYMF